MEAGSLGSGTLVSDDMSDDDYCPPESPRQKRQRVEADKGQNLSLQVEPDPEVRVSPRSIVTSSPEPLLTERQKEKRRQQQKMAHLFGSDSAGDSRPATLTTQEMEEEMWGKSQKRSEERTKKVDILESFKSQTASSEEEEDDDFSSIGNRAVGARPLPLLRTTQNSPSGKKLPTTLTSVETVSTKKEYMRRLESLQECKLSSLSMSLQELIQAQQYASNVLNALIDRMAVEHNRK